MIVQATYMMAALALAAGDDPALLPDDARLAAERAPLQALVERTASQGLPVDLLLSKIREGLAKNVQPARIRAASERLVSALSQASDFVAARRSGPPGRELLQAVAQAQLSGCPLHELDAIVRSPQAAEPTARAIDVLVDLQLRGYPVQPAARLVDGVLAHEPGAIERLPAALEIARREQALSPVEVMALLTPARPRVDGLPAELQRLQARERAGGRLQPASEVRGPRGQARGRRR